LTFFEVNLNIIANGAIKIKKNRNKKIGVNIFEKIYPILIKKIFKIL